MSTTKTEPILAQPKQCIKVKSLVKAPKSCPYENFFIEIEYTNGEKQVLTHKIPNPNHFGKHEFENKEELIEYYNTLITV